MTSRAHRRHRRRREGTRTGRGAVALAGVLVLGACGVGTTGGPPSAPAGSGTPAATASSAPTVAASGSAPMPDAAHPCGGERPDHYRHVVWVWMENKGRDAVMGSPDAPFENRLARECGLATDYHGITHPSLPNYLAATGGSTFGVADDAPPSAHPLRGESLFGQVESAGLTWRAYAESMPSPCLLADAGRYAVRHNPATYFTDLRVSCRQHDLGLAALGRDLAAGSLPSFSFVTPDLCSDTHDCPVSTGDAWLRTWLTRVLDSPDYRAGDTLVVLTWDEAEGHGTTVPTLVVAPSVPVGTVVDRRLDHYSLLRTTEDLLGLPPLRHASTAPSMAPAFGL